jgi:hypothetical protein
MLGRRTHRSKSGETLIAVMRASPHREIELDPARAPMPVRDRARGARAIRRGADSWRME